MTKTERIIKEKPDWANCVYVRKYSRVNVKEINAAGLNVIVHPSLSRKCQYAFGQAKTRRFSLPSKNPPHRVGAGNE